MRNKLISLFAIAAVLPFLAEAQFSASLQSINQTSLASAVSVDALQVVLSANFTTASPLSGQVVANGVNIASLANTGVGSAVGSYLYVVDPGNQKGELMQVVSLVSTGRYNVKRGVAGTAQVAHVSGAMVLVGSPNAFYSSDPQGSCSTSAVNGFAGQQISNLYVNVLTGSEWICSTVSNTWVPGFNNPAQDNLTPTTAVASAAALTPSGPFFHMTGTTTITSVNLPLGFVAGSFSVVTDTAATALSTAGNNVGTTVGATTAGQVKTFTYDAIAAKFYSN